MPNILTEATQMTCIHGATITAQPTEARVQLTTGKPLKPTDVFTVSGCPFTIPVGPATIPSPCTVIVWQVPTMRTKGQTGPFLTQTSIGVCYSALGFPQGVVVAGNPDPRAGAM